MFIFPYFLAYVSQKYKWTFTPYKLRAQKHLCFPYTSMHSDDTLCLPCSFHKTIYMVWTHDPYTTDETEEDSWVSASRVCIIWPLLFTQMVSHPGMWHFMTVFPSSILRSMIVTPHMQALSCRSRAFLTQCHHVPTASSIPGALVLPWGACWALVNGVGGAWGGGMSIFVDSTKSKVGMKAVVATVAMGGGAAVGAASWICWTDSDVAGISETVSVMVGAVEALGSGAMVLEGGGEGDGGQAAGVIREANRVQ